MNVFKRIIKAWLFDNQYAYTKKYENMPDALESSLLKSGNYINFNLYYASGGYVVEYRSYDHNNGTHTPFKLAIITNEEDWSKRLKEIVFMEELSR